MTASLEHVNGRPVAPFAEPRFDPLALAQAEAIRTRAEAEAEALRIEAEGKAKAAEILAAQEAEKQRIINERAAIKLEVDRAVQVERVAKSTAAAAEAEAAAERTRRAVEAEAEQAATREQEELRSENTWKWAARGIYAVGLIIAAPLQFLAFWDEERPFMIAAPALLEGLALTLAFGAAWAIAHRRDVLPYRIGIMIGALIAAGVNLYHGWTDTSIGFDAGLIGGLASLGGPIVLMAYEHGISQKADGIPSWRERRDTAKAAEKATREAAEKAAEKKAAEEARAAEKKAAEEASDAEQKRKDADRQRDHEAVWKVAEAMRSARGLAFVTDQIWAEAWLRVTGSKLVGVWPELEARSRAAQAEMKAASEGALSQVESQMPPRPKREPNALDARRFNGGIPPLRTAGDTKPYSDLARKAASITARQIAAAEEKS